MIITPIIKGLLYNGSSKLTEFSAPGISGISEVDNGILYATKKGNVLEIPEPSEIKYDYFNKPIEGLTAGVWLETEISPDAFDNSNVVSKDVFKIGAQEGRRLSK